MCSKVFIDFRRLGVTNSSSMFSLYPQTHKPTIGLITELLIPTVIYIKWVNILVDL